MCLSSFNIIFVLSRWYIRITNSWNDWDSTSGIYHSSGNHFVASTTWRKQTSRDETLPFKVHDVRRRVFLDDPWLATRLLIKRRTMKHSHSANSISDSRIKYAPSGSSLAHTNIIRVIRVPNTISFIIVLYKIVRLLMWSNKNNRTRSKEPGYLNYRRIAEKLGKISIARNNWRSMRTADKKYIRTRTECSRITHTDTHANSLKTHCYSCLSKIRTTRLTEIGRMLIRKIVPLDHRF